MTATSSHTPTATATSTTTRTATATATVTRTATQTATSTATSTVTRTATATATATLIPTTAAPTPTVTLTGTATATATQVPTPTPSSAIAFIGQTTSASTKLTVPSGVQNGDLLLASYSFWSSSSATAPSGWNLLQSAAANGSGVTTVWYRFASNDTPGSSYTWTFSGTAYESGGMTAYRGVDQSALEDGFCTNSGKSTSPTLCSFATANDGDFYVGFYATEAAALAIPAI